MSCLQFLSKIGYLEIMRCKELINDGPIGGSLGWKIRGSLDPAFEKAAYELEPSTTGNPKYVEVKTGFGYHLIMVEGRK